VEQKKSLLTDRKGVLNIFYMLIAIGISIAIIFVIFGVVIPNLGQQVDDSQQIDSTRNLIHSEDITALDCHLALDHSTVNGTYQVWNATDTLVSGTGYSVDDDNGSIRFWAEGGAKYNSPYYVSYYYEQLTQWHYINENMSANVLSWVGSVNLVIVISLLALVIMAVAGMMVYSRGGRGGM